ncbi:MAG: hypothetical protein HZB51_05610 [Chloroflexi bacterium]|nr:hypothetical protein [Chloroflexota bacterium]
MILSKRPNYWVENGRRSVLGQWNAAASKNAAASIPYAVTQILMHTLNQVGYLPSVNLHVILERTSSVEHVLRTMILITLE